jgi:pantothenate kinase
MKECLVTPEELAAEIRRRHGARRLLVGLAGAPGSGKSTLAERLATDLNRTEPGLAAVLPMDGYHFDDAVLRDLGRLPRKGAPDTFDVGGLAQMLKRLSENAEEAVAVPVFDRSIETARAGGRLIPSSVGIIIVEGNYLLLKRPPWNQLGNLFDVTVMIRTSPETLRRRLEDRWRGFGLPESEVRRKVDTNDLPNGMTMLAESAEADFHVVSD